MKNYKQRQNIHISPFYNKHAGFISSKSNQIENAGLISLRIFLYFEESFNLISNIVNKIVIILLKITLLILTLCFMITFN
jgi:hypothetical protein